LNLGDTVDSALPNLVLFGTAVRAGEWAMWNPYALGGTPLGATPNYGVASPVALPFWFLPPALAPGYMKLLEVICAVGGSFLFLRRLRLGRAAALLGGLVFASSAFMVVWSNWPQTRVATFIPVLFWALECLVQGRRIRDAALIALPVAAMLLGGFPAVTGYALLTGGCYLLVRVVAENWGRWRRVAGLLAGAGAGVAAGAALVAFQLVPWAYSMSTAAVGARGQGSDDHIPFSMLVTTIAPFAFGTVSPDEPPQWFQVRIFIEGVSYVGAAALALAVVAGVLSGRARAVMPRASWAFLLVATVVWMVVIYVGHLPLALLQRLPALFSDNFVGRGRSVLGFLVAVLAAVGFELLLRRRAMPSGGDRRGGRRRGVARPGYLRGYPAAVWLVVGLVGAVAFWKAYRWAVVRDAARDPADGVGHYASWLTGEVAVGLAFVAGTVMCAAWLWWAPNRSTQGSRAGRLGVATLIPVLVAAQALMLVRSYYPRTEPADFYPTTGAHAYLAGHLGHDRYYGANGAIYGNTDTIHQLRGLHGHSFADHALVELLEAMPGRQFDTPPTYLNGTAARGAVPRSPILDRLGVRYYLMPVSAKPFGRQNRDPGDGSTVELRPQRPTSVAVSTTAPVRGIGITVTAPVTATGARLAVAVALRTREGRQVAQARRLLSSLAAGELLYVPLAADDAAAGHPLIAEISVSRPVTVNARDGRPALAVVSGADDGYRLVYDDAVAIYERTTALPRLRWASQAIVEPDPQKRLALLASGTVTAEQVVLASAGPAADGAPARVTWVADHPDDMVARVDARGAGYLELADALQHSWAVTVDGKAAKLVPADHGVVAVHLPAGKHTVRFFYTAPAGNIGGWISGLAVILLLSVVGAEWWAIRHRPSPPTGAGRSDPTRTHESKDLDASQIGERVTVPWRR
jgi:hypothetical protein